MHGCYAGAVLPAPVGKTILRKAERSSFPFGGLIKLSLHIKLYAAEEAGTMKCERTRPIPDSQVVALLQDDIQLVHGWIGRMRSGLCITGSNYVDALQREEGT